MAKYRLGDKVRVKRIIEAEKRWDHVLSWSNEGDLVLDPMCGSGTTCKMAKLNGRKYIGIDIAEEYVEMARRRVEE